MQSLNAWSQFRAWNQLLAIFMLQGLLGCNQPNQPIMDGLKAVQAAAATETIQSIRQRTTYGITVVLKGKVENQVPLLKGAAYELKDATGSIWILANESAPKPGDEVVVKGTLRYQSISLNGKEQGSPYIEQQEQLQHSPSQQKET